MALVKRSESFLPSFFDRFFNSDLMDWNLTNFSGPVSYTHLQEMRAKVIEAEAKVPLAIAEAFKLGNLGVMDYMRYKNIMSDTSMRESIAGEEKKRSDRESQKE